MIAAAAKQCEEGDSIAEALQQGRQFFPHFFLPLIAAGELAGRQVEAFRLIHEHSERLRPTREVIRKTWLYPLVCLLFGWTVRVGLFLGFGLYSEAWEFGRETFLVALLLWIGGWLLWKLPFVRYMLDHVQMQLPLFREVDLERSTAYFFAAFRLLYTAGGLSVLAIFDAALATVRNIVVRRDFTKARAILEQHGGFEDAFLAPSLVDDESKGIIASSAMAGKLDSGLDQVVARTHQRLALALTIFNHFFHRAVGYIVAMSIASALWYCLSRASGK